MLSRLYVSLATLVGLAMLVSLGSCLSSSATKVKSIEVVKKRVDRETVWVDSLLAIMTFEEKLGQLQQLDGGISKQDLPALIEQGRVGSVLNEVEPRLIAKYQKIAVEKSRLGIPLLIGRDVVHGFRTMFPIPLAQSATWNTDIVKLGAEIAARESSSVGINWTFAPMIDITRDPRWGRVAESPGEDAYLTTQMGIAMIDGFQGSGRYADGNVAACAKHFAAYGMAEGGRDYNSAIVGERHLREVYLRPFKAAVEHGAMSFMTAFNEVNDVPASGNEFLLRQVLRDEWGYDGLVVSDWESIIEMIAHGYCADDKQAAYRAIKAGVDMEMTSTSYHDHLAALVSEGQVTMQHIDDAVSNILTMKYRLGLFDHPYPLSSSTQAILSAEHLAAAKSAAVECAVLLHNDNATLPLTSKLKSIAVIGPMADAPHEQLGTWSFDGKKADAITPLQALKTELADEVDIHYAAGLEISRTMEQTGFGEAIAAANRSEVVLYFVGEEAILSGEAHSRAHLDLPGAQSELLDELVKTGKSIVLVVMAGRPLVLTDLLPKVDAVLYAWHGGTMAGPAIADLLTGKANPSGKLPITFPRAVGQIPIYHSHKNTGRPSSEDKWIPMADIPVEAWQTSLGNTSHYLDEGFKPLFPFGYGLSYTSFDYGDITLSDNTTSSGATVTASIEVANTGSADGHEVVQLYIQDLFGSVTRPVKELKDFKKVFLKVGERKTVTFDISTDQLSFFKADGTFGVEAGDFKVFIGGHSATTDHQVLTVEDPQ